MTEMTGTSRGAAMVETPKNATLMEGTIQVVADERTTMMTEIKIELLMNSTTVATKSTTTEETSDEEIAIATMIEKVEATDDATMTTEMRRIGVLMEAGVRVDGIM
jgi:hypothetical protein